MNECKPLGAGGGGEEEEDEGEGGSSGAAAAYLATHGAGVDQCMGISAAEAWAYTRPLFSSA